MYGGAAGLSTLAWRCGVDIESLTLLLALVHQSSGFCPCNNIKDQSILNYYRIKH